MGNDSTTAFRTREQLRKFLGIFSPRFPKPKLEFLGQIASATNRRGIFVCDRGGDGDNMFKFYIDHGYDFIVRLAGDRNLLNWGGKTKDSMVLAEALARQCTLRYEDSVLYKSHNRVHNIRIKYGSMPVRLPVRPEAELRLVVVKWPKGEKPMMPLTTLDAVRTRKALWEVVQGYITRWRVEETIRYIKQSYRLERMRLLDYQRLKNMAALVVAVSYFAAAWLGRKVKLEALANHVAKVSRKMYEAPEFFYYAIADGLRWLFVCHGRWRGLDCVREKHGDLQMEFELLSG